MPLDSPNPIEQMEQTPAVEPYTWRHKLSALVFIVFCLEIGVVLLIMPWSEYWDNNFFATWTPAARDFWESSYVRGAVSGLGIVNIFISFTELFRMRRFSRSR